MSSPVQLDRTRIVIRRRSIWEILDLSLRVTRKYAQPLFVWTGIVALPFAAVNMYALDWIVEDEYTARTISRYLWQMTLLVFIESPIVTIPATQILGRVMFMQEFHTRSIVHELVRLAGRLIWTQGIWRGGILVVILAFTITSSRNSSVPEFFLTFLAIYSLLVRSVRPFINEVVLLERTPLRRTARNRLRITLRRRLASLHGPRTFDLMVRWWVISVATVALTGNLILTSWFIASMLSSNWQWGPLLVKLISPACMWAVAVFAAVVKFLNYIDLRIRDEGWEVELLVKAAAHELRGSQA